MYIKERPVGFSIKYNKNLSKNMAERKKNIKDRKKRRSGRKRMPISNKRKKKRASNSKAALARREVVNHLIPQLTTMTRSFRHVTNAILIVQ